MTDRDPLNPNLPAQPSSDPDEAAAVPAQEPAGRKAMTSTRWVLAGLGALALMMGGAFLSTADYADAGSLLGRGDGHHGGFFGKRSCGHGEDGARSEQMQRRVLMATGLALDRIDADDDQRTQINRIVELTFADMADFHGQRGRAREALVRELTADQIDRAALETLRTDKLDGLDTMSARMVEALADIGDVLSPDQRMLVAEHLSRWHG